MRRNVIQHGKLRRLLQTQGKYLACRGPVGIDPTPSRPQRSRGTRQRFLQEAALRCLPEQGARLMHQAQRKRSGRLVIEVKMGDIIPGNVALPVFPPAGKVPESQTGRPLQANHVCPGDGDGKRPAATSVARVAERGRLTQGCFLTGRVIEQMPEPSCYRQNRYKFSNPFVLNQDNTVTPVGRSCSADRSSDEKTQSALKLANQVAGVARGKMLVNLVVDVRAQEPHGAVAEEKMRTARVVAAEIVNMVGRMVGRVVR